MFKKLFCKHEWVKVKTQRFGWNGKTNELMEGFYCSKCKKVKTISTQPLYTEERQEMMKLEIMEKIRDEQ